MFCVYARHHHAYTFLTGLATSYKKRIKIANKVNKIKISLIIKNTINEIINKNIYDNKYIYIRGSR
jgi:hypothetical protein